MNEERYIAAIEISSSKISGAVGRVRNNAPTRLEVLAVETERITDIVNHGSIVNIEMVGNCVGRIVKRLEQRISTNVKERKIKRLYVGLSGRSLRNIKTEITRNLPDDTEITDSLLQSLRLDARNSSIDGTLEVCDAIPRSFSVNNNETYNPVGICGNKIVGRYNLIVCRPLLSKHLMRVIRDKAGLGVADLVITPLALGDLVLSSDERRLGCMLVDMGAETTTVSLYKDNTLVYLAVLPMGSRNITLDITSLNILEDKAEDIKTKSGSAIMPENQSSLNISGVRMIDVNNRIVARSEEIVANIVEQIEYAGMSAKNLPGKIVIAGGGFHLNKMAELLRGNSDLSVRRATLPVNISFEDTQASGYDCLQLVSILYAGLHDSSMECIEEVVSEELPAIGTYVEEEKPEKKEEEKKPSAPTHGSRIWDRVSRLSSTISNIFGPNVEDDDDDTDL